MPSARVHLDDAVDGVLDLVEVVAVPAGGQPLTLVDAGCRRRVAAVAQVDPVPGPIGTLIDGLESDGSADRAR